MVYYLQSRYYNPQWGRFLNADLPEIAQQSKDEINGLNLFAYCCNDPVNNSDPTGFFPFIASLIIGAIVGIMVLYFVDDIYNMVNNKSQWWKPTSTVSEYVASGFLGAISTLSLSKKSVVIISSVVSGATYIANCIEKGNKIDIVKLLLSLAIGAFCGAISEGGMALKNKLGIIKTSENKLKTLCSIKKVTQYTNKIRNNMYSLIISTVRLKISTAIGGILNKLQEKFGKSIRNKIEIKLKRVIV